MNNDIFEDNDDTDLGIPGGITGKVQSIGKAVIGRARGAIDVGTTAVGSRRDARVRDGLLRDLGRQHLATLTDSADQDEIERLVAEINKLDGTPEASTSENEEEE